MKNKINPFNLPAATNLIIAASIIIIGSIFRKSHSVTGHWITVVGMGYFLLLNAWTAWKSIRDFSAQSPKTKAHTLIVCVMLYLFIKSFFVADISYFIILVLLAVEYLMIEPEKGNNNGTDQPTAEE